VKKINSRKPHISISGPLARYEKNLFAGKPMPPTLVILYPLLSSILAESFAPR